MDKHGDGGKNLALHRTRALDVRSKSLLLLKCCTHSLLCFCLVFDVRVSDVFVKSMCVVFFVFFIVFLIFNFIFLLLLSSFFKVLLFLLIFLFVGYFSISTTSFLLVNIFKQTVANYNWRTFSHSIPELTNFYKVFHLRQGRSIKIGLVENIYFLGT